MVDIKISGRKVSVSDSLREHVEEKVGDALKVFDIKPMTCEEAVLQMNLVGHTFFAFKDEANGGAFSVVYRRNDDGYGLIEDEE